MLQSMNHVEGELASAKAKVTELQQLNTNLSLELESRPSVKEFRAAKKKLHELETLLEQRFVSTCVCLCVSFCICILTIG